MSDIPGRFLTKKIEIWDEVRYQVQNPGIPRQLRVGTQSFNYFFRQVIAVTMGHFQ
jgi:hypothetical protein